MRQRFAAVRSWSSGFVALVAYACSSGGVAPPRTATPPSPRDSASTAASHEWLVRRDTGRWRYRVQTDARVTLTADTSAPTAPIRSIAIYTITVDRTPDGLRITGTVDSTALSAGGRVPQRTADPTKATFGARLDSVAGLSALTMDSAHVPSCVGGLDPVVADVRSLFFTIPARVHSGATWQDSTTIITCRGSVPVASTVRRSYTAGDTTSWNGRHALRVNIRSESTLEGSGVTSAAGDSIRVRGSGTSSGLLLIDPGTAMPLTTTLTGRASVTVTSRQTSLPFDQKVTEGVTLLDGPPARP